MAMKMLMNIYELYFSMIFLNYDDFNRKYNVYIYIAE